MHLQTFLSVPVTQKCQILSCDTLVANERYNFSVAGGITVEFYEPLSMALSRAYFLFIYLFIYLFFFFEKGRQEKINHLLKLKEMQTCSCRLSR